MAQTSEGAKAQPRQRTPQGRTAFAPLVHGPLNPLADRPLDRHDLAIIERIVAYPSETQPVRAEKLGYPLSTLAHREMREAFKVALVSEYLRGIAVAAAVLPRAVLKLALHGRDAQARVQAMKLLQHMIEQTRKEAREAGLHVPSSPPVMLNLFAGLSSADQALLAGKLEAAQVQAVSVPAEAVSDAPDAAQRPELLHESVHDGSGEDAESSANPSL